MTSERQNRAATAVPIPVLLAYSVVVASIWVSLFFPDARLWGVSWYLHYSWAVRIGFLALAGLAVIALPRLITATSTPTVASKRSYFRFCLGAGLVAGLLFVFLRAKTFFLGDGVQVLAKLQSGGEHVKPWDIPIWTLQRTLYQIAGGDGESAALVALQSLSVVCGLVLVVTVCWAASKLFERMWRRVLFVLGTVCGGYTLLFFGYVENYPLFVTAVAVFLMLGLLVARSRISRYWLFVAAVPSIALHPFGLFLLPTLLYLLIHNTSIGNRLAGLGVVAKSTLALLIVCGGAFGAFCLWSNNYFFRFSLVPPVTDLFTVEGYTLFSSSHLLDLLNLIIMLAPGLLLVMASLIDLPVRRLLKRPDYVMLAVATISALTVIAVVNPRLGMARDWDLFCFAGLPMVLASIYLLLDERIAIRGGEVTAALAIVLSLLLLGPRVVSQVDPERSISVFDKFASLDVIKSRNGRFLLQEYLEREGRTEEYNRRARLNAAVLPHENLHATGRRLGDEGRWEEAVDKFKQALRYDPAYPYAWANLGVVYRWMNRLDSAIICLKIADGLNPYSYSTYMKLAGTYYGRGDLDTAESYWYRAAAVNPKDVEGRGYLLKLYHEQDRVFSYDSLLTVLTERTNTPAWIFAEAARRAVIDSSFSSARLQFQEAIGRGLDSTRILKLLDEHPGLATPPD